jgi:hypothetical protein
LKEKSSDNCKFDIIKTENDVKDELPNNNSNIDFLNNNSK